MVRLTEVPDEHFQEKRGTTKDDVLLTTDDEDDYTDTGKASSPSRLQSLVVFSSPGGIWIATAKLMAFPLEGRMTLLIPPPTDKTGCCPDSEISVASDQDLQDSESFFDRVTALVDIVPPSARAKISSSTSSVASFTGSALKFTGKSLWVVSTSVLLLGIPYALAFSQEQEIMEREREEGMMREGASSVRLCSKYPSAWS